MNTALVGQRVHVYRNRHTGGYSVRQHGRVIAHVDVLTLVDVEFRVQPAGRLRAIKEKRRNVHAYVVGTVTEPLGARPCGDCVKVTYSPFHHETFVHADRDARPVTTAAIVHLCPQGAFAHAA